MQAGGGSTRVGSGRVFLPEIVERQRGASGSTTLVELGGIAAGNRLRFILDGHDAVADGEALQRQVHEPARAFVRDHLEMIGLAADHDAERDKGAEASAAGGE